MAKDGLVDFGPVRALRLILCMEVSYQPAELDRLKRLSSDLALLKRSGLILDFTLLDP